MTHNSWCVGMLLTTKKSKEKERLCHQPLKQHMTYNSSLCHTTLLSHLLISFLDQVYKHEINFALVTQVILIK